MTRRVVAGLCAVALIVSGCGTTVARAMRSASGPDSSLGASGGGEDIGPRGLPSRSAGTPPTSAGAAVDPGTTRGGASAATGQLDGGAAGTAGTLGSSAVRGPLTIGALYSDNGAANAALGVTTTASADPKSLINALVAALNKQGGLAGRPVSVIYHPVEATSSDYSTQANAACASFTQDRPVPVVLDFIFGTRYGMAACLAKRGVADFGIGTSDTVADNAAGLFAAPDWITSSRRYPAVLAGLHATGYLTAGNKIGVLLEDCGYLHRAYDQTVVPTIARLGLHAVDTETIACTAGFSSAEPASTSIASATLRFRSHAVDRVIIVSDYEQVVLLLLANEAESQGWRPGYLLSSTAETEAIRSNIPSGQWPQLHGVGWSPGLDIDDPGQPLPSTDQRCLDLIKQGGVVVSGWQNVFVATTWCADVLFLGAALRASAGDAHGAALMTAIGSLGSSFVAPGIVGGRTTFGTSRRDGPGLAAPFAYVSACQCLRYTGPPAAVP